MTPLAIHISSVGNTTDGKDVDLHIVNNSEYRAWNVRVCSAWARRPPKMRVACAPFAVHVTHVHVIRTCWQVNVNGLTYSRQGQGRKGAFGVINLQAPRAADHPMHPPPGLVRGLKHKIASRFHDRWCDYVRAPRPQLLE